MQPFTGFKNSLRFWGSVGQESRSSWRTQPAVEYFELPIIQAHKTSYLIYFCNDHDGVVTDKDQKILAFASPDALREHARKKKWKIKSAQPELNIDLIQQWIRNVDVEELDCPALYRVWNLFGDMATSIGMADDFPGYQDHAMTVHEELFWGCNLPGSAPADRPYQARLTIEDAATLKNVLQTGLEIFLTNIKDLA
jgi:hypothetical protein